MNLANKITLSRIAIMPLFIIGIINGGIGWHVVAIICFTYASFSDWLDGALARKGGYISDFGKFMDPLADKIFISSAFISFIAIPELNIPAWMIIIIISREFMITGLRTLALSKGIVMHAKTSGKFKTSFQLIAIGLILVILFLKSLNVSFWQEWFNRVPFIAVLFVTFFTVFSGYQYMIEHKNLFTTEEDISK